jgi:hypothetical protein
LSLKTPQGAGPAVANSSLAGPLFCWRRSGDMLSLIGWCTCRDASDRPSRLCIRAFSNRHCEDANLPVHVRHSSSIVRCRISTTDRANKRYQNYKVRSVPPTRAQRLALSPSHRQPHCVNRCYSRCKRCRWALGVASPRGSNLAGLQRHPALAGPQQWLAKADKRAFWTATSKASQAADYLRALALADAMGNAA